MTSLYQYITDKQEVFHTILDFRPKLELLSEQWPRNDDQVYDAILWDREYSFLFGFEFSAMLEVGHAAYYKVVGQLNVFQAGFGLQDILFERLPTHYCTLYYIDSRLMQSQVHFETNTKKCAFKSGIEDQMAWHFDSRPMTEVPENEDDDGRAFGDLLTNLLKVN